MPDVTDLTSAIREYLCELGTALVHARQGDAGALDDAADIVFDLDIALLRMELWTDESANSDADLVATAIDIVQILIRLATRAIELGLADHAV